MLAIANSLPRRGIVPRRTVVFSSLAATMLALAPLPALSDTFPSKPISLILPFPPGGPVDALLRALSAAASQDLGRPIVLMHKPGNSGVLGTASLTQGVPADGYTLAMMHNSVIREPLVQKVNWNPLKDFTYLIALAGFTTGVSVRAEAPWKTLQELIDDAKARPSVISYGTVGAISANRIAGERLARLAGTTFNMVPFKGGSEASTALIGGHIDVWGDPGFGPLARSGRIRLLATASDTRPKGWPDVPTLKELGYDVSVTSPLGLVAPKGMDSKLQARLYAAFKNASDDPAYKRLLEDFDMAPFLMTGEEYHDYAVKQFARERAMLDEIEFKLD